MKTKLLRALQHLRSATQHIEEANTLVSASYVYGVDFSTAELSVKELSAVAGAKYTQYLVNSLPHAKEPK